MFDYHLCDACGELYSDSVLREKPDGSIVCVYCIEDGRATGTCDPQGPQPHNQPHNQLDKEITQCLDT